AQDINSTVVIVGDGDQRSELEELANELEVDVRFEGHVDPENVNMYYQNASVFVYPSIEGEGLPNSVLEAMASGLPVVATDSGGLPTLVEDGETGYIVPMRDPDALAQHINQLLEDTERRVEMGRKAREYVIQNHSWDRIVDELENIYDRVI
ncbi:MAG: glycosyltransferase family 4 protein, partial [Halobacteria archaeon]|nr:glycosyltransferase family 4 protein [Halobacteria archaeon]